MSMRSVVSRVALLTILAACDHPPPPAGMPDTGPRDAAAIVDARDVGTDAGSADGGPVVADAGLDAMASDAGPCRWPDGALDICTCGPSLGMDCSAASCPTGMTCTADVCGMHCSIAGSSCGIDADCPSGATCSDGICTTSGTTCTDSRTCPLGFACEAGACVDRRFPCASDGSCPLGYACNRAMAGGTCVRLSRRCSSGTACAATLSDHQVCTDVDGDGNDECQFADGSCVTNADCSGGQTCTARSISGVASCGRYGVCHADTNCLPGQHCRDLWGDGVSECVDTGGCTSTSSCPSRQVCATPVAGGPPVCAGG